MSVIPGVESVSFAVDWKRAEELWEKGNAANLINMYGLLHTCMFTCAVGLMILLFLSRCICFNIKGHVKNWERILCVACHEMMIMLF